MYVASILGLYAPLPMVNPGIITKTFAGGRNITTIICSGLEWYSQSQIKLAPVGNLIGPRFIGEGPINSVLFVRSFVCNTVFSGSVHYWTPDFVEKGSYKFSPVRPSVRSSIRLGRSFLGICSLLFSETWQVVRGRWKLKSDGAGFFQKIRIFIL